MVMGSNLWEEAKGYVVGKHEKRKEKRKRKKTADLKEKSEVEYVGPDTSSLTAFLASLLSLSEPTTTRKDEKAADGTDSDGDTSASSSHSKSEQDYEQGKCFLADSGGVEKRDQEDVPSTSGGDDLDADWQIVSKKDLINSRYFEFPKVQVMQQQDEHPQPNPVKLPDMSEVSSLLPADLRKAIYSSLPTLAKGRQWVLLYSTLRHGISLRTLYRKAALIPGPCLLVLGDRLGAVFGGLLSSPKPTPKKKYQGTNDSFVFTNVGGSPQVFRPTGANRYYVLCTNEALAFGGGGHFALHVDSELLYGSSAACETYGSPGLATTEDFVVKDVELWGFAHTSKYVPFHASFKEPEVVRGIYSW